MSAPLDAAIASLEEQAVAARAAGEQHRSRSDQVLQQFLSGLFDAVDDEVADRVAAVARDAFGVVVVAVDDAWEAIGASLDRERRAVEAAKTGGDAGGGGDGGGTGVGSGGTSSGSGAGPSPFVDATVAALVGVYRTASGYAKRKVSEQLGEAAGVWVLRTESGQQIDVRYPTRINPVPDGVATEPGVPWEAAVAFAGPHVTNIVWWDGSVLQVIEAKGGDSQYGTRQAGTDRNGVQQVVHQGSRKYLRQIADAMTNSRIQDGRNQIGALLTDGIEDGDVRYRGVRCGPRSQIENGPADDTLVTQDDFHADGGRWGWPATPAGQKGP